MLKVYIKKKKYKTSFIDGKNKFINGKSSKKIIQSVHIDVENLFGEYSVSYFTDTPRSIFSKLVQLHIICLTSYSAGPERAVSIHTK